MTTLLSALAAKLGDEELSVAVNLKGSKVNTRVYAVDRLRKL